MAYRGSKVTSTRVDRPDEGLATEQTGAGGTGKARSTLDSGIAGKTRVEAAHTVVDTSGIGITPDAGLKRAINSAGDGTIV